MTYERKRASPATPEKYLWQRGRLFWFRYAVPVRFRLVESRRIVQKPLKTTDRRQASVLAASMRGDLHLHWERLVSGQDAASGQRQSFPSEVDLQLAATEVAYLRVQPKLAQLFLSKRPDAEGSYQANVDALRRGRDRFLRGMATQPQALWQNLANKEIQRRGWELAAGSAAHDAFVRMILEAAVEVLTAEIAEREGRFGHEPSSIVVQMGLKARAEAARPGETIMELFERYADQRLAEKRKRPDGIKQDRKVVRSFAAFVGEGRSARSLAPADVRNWRDLIAALPPTYAKSKAYAGLSIREAAAKAKAVGAKTVSPTTVNKNLSTISPFLGWCVTNAYAERNPCDGLFYDVPKGKNPRPPFSDEQLESIFSSPLFTGFVADGKEHLPGKMLADDWRYWIPLICLFTGARIGEIAQLRIGDIQSENDIPFILIRHDEKLGLQTKSGHSRPAPIHSKLQALGFLSFVERQRALSSVNGQLFPELSPNKRGHIGAVPSRFWRKYLERIGAKAGSDGFGAHSFRHTMADRLREAGYLDDEIEVALGHNQKTVTGGYGRMRQGTVARISAMLEQVDFAKILLKCGLRRGELEEP